MLARDLQNALGYSDWRNFLNVVEKAKKTYVKSKYEFLDHFGDANKMISIAKGAIRQIEDLKLSFYASSS